MMHNIRNSSKLIVLILILIISIAGCKSKKKAMEASNAAKEKARIEQEASLRKQQEDEAKRKEAEEDAKRKAEALKAGETKILEPRIRLNDYFETIAKSGNATSANTSINEALTLFASPETPVLIIISEEGGLKDYDRPTTIREYLHYLKDQKKNSNILSGLKVDSAGKITEVELKKTL